MTTASAGWRYSSLEIVHLDPGQGRSGTTGDDEVVMVPLSGSLRVEVDGYSEADSPSPTLFALTLRTSWVSARKVGEGRLRVYDQYADRTH